MNPQIIFSKEKLIIGIRQNFSLSNNKTFELWQRFMPRRNEIKNRVNSEFLSIQIYTEDFDFSSFNPDLEFEKWAAVEVTCNEFIPYGLEASLIHSGLYAVFLYKGLQSAFSETFRYIFEIWLPSSDYVIDNRAHFEIIGEKYKNNHPDSEEEIWIPIKKN